MSQLSTKKTNNKPQTTDRPMSLSEESAFRTFYKLSVLAQLNSGNVMTNGNFLIGIVDFKGKQ